VNARNGEDIRNPDFLWISINAYTKIFRGEMYYLEELFPSISKAALLTLDNWESRITGFCDEYEAECDPSQPASIISTNPHPQAVYLFDLTFERVVVAYAVSMEAQNKRDTARMRGFPDVDKRAKGLVGDNLCDFDKGHFLSHAAGGELDINLFPHCRKLNRGWSQQGKIFRHMEKWVSDHPGTFYYHRALYNDNTWIPDQLEYGILKNDINWDVQRFDNKI